MRAFFAILKICSAHPSSYLFFFSRLVWIKLGLLPLGTLTKYQKRRSRQRMKQSRLDLDLDLNLKVDSNHLKVLYGRGLYALLGHSCTAIFRMAIRTFEISRYFTVACSKDRKIGSGRLVKREVQMRKIGLADRRKCTWSDRNASILMARACSHFDRTACRCFVRVQELTPTAVNRIF